MPTRKVIKPTVGRNKIFVYRVKRLMAKEKIKPTDLLATLKKFKKLKVHVVGDLIVDKNTKCELLGASQKSPTLTARIFDSEIFVGAAGVVSKHLKSLGAKVTFTTVVGNDKEAKFAINDLRKINVGVNAVRDQKRFTTIFHRYILKNGQSTFETLSVNNENISPNIEKKIIKLIKNHKSDLVVFSDFRRGIFNFQNCNKFIKAIPQNSVKVADSQVSDRWGNILEFQEFDLITPDEREARICIYKQDLSTSDLAKLLYNKAGCKNLIITLREKGLVAYSKNENNKEKLFHLDSFANPVIDPLGSGDAFLSGSSLAIAVSGNIVQSSIIGNICAAIACSKIGNQPVSMNEIQDFIKNRL